MNVECAFFDTNVLIYLHDEGQSAKQAVARELFRRHFLERRVALSTQVLQEFYVTITRKTVRMPVKQARALLADYAQMLLVTIHASHILQAIDWSDRYQVSFWDALILAAAKSAGATVVYSEDLSHTQNYGGVRVVNPFVQDVTAL